jgi:hypothetical protein
VGGAFLVLGLFASLGVHADQQRCLDAARVDSYIHEFNIKTPVDRCAVGSTGYQVLKSLMNLDDIRPLTITADNYDRQIVKGTPMEFYRARVHTIVIDAATSEDCDSAAAYVDEDEKNVMHICPDFSGTEVDMMGTLMHEARHVDGFPHFQCNHGIYAGSGLANCDRSYEWGGAYAVEVEFEVRYSRTESLPEELREQARALAVDNLINDMNEGPFGLRTGVFLENDRGEVSFYDGAKNVGLVQVDPRNDVLISRNSELALYNAGQGSVTTYLTPEHSLPTLGDYATSFRAQPSGERAKFIDAIYLVQASCLLYVDKLICDQLEKHSEFSLQNIRPMGLLNWKGAPAIRDSSGDLYVLPVNKIGAKDVSEKDLTRVENTAKISAQVNLNKFFYELRIDGGLWQVPRKKSVKPTPLLSEQRFVKLLGPSFWSEELAGF